MNQRCEQHLPSPNILKHTLATALSFHPQLVSRTYVSDTEVAEALTQQRDDAAQDGQQGSGAQAGGGVGDGAAGQGHAVRVALAHSHRQRVGAAERRRAAVHDQHGQPVHGLVPAAEAAALGQDGRCVVCGCRAGVHHTHCENTTGLFVLLKPVIYTVY